MDSIIIDSHSNLIIDIYMRKDRGERNVFRKYHYKEHIENGFKILFLVVGGDDNSLWSVPNSPLASTLKNISYIIDETNNFDKILIIDSKKRIHDVLSDSSKIGLLLSLEGGMPIEKSPKILDMMHKIGLRSIGLTWNYRNMLADGCGEERTRSRLTRLGIRILDRIESLKIILDVSHLSESCFWDIINNFNGTLIASHSNCRSLCNHPRNLTDEQIQAIADRKGVIGVCFYPRLIDDTTPNIHRLIDHIEHIEKLVGIDYIAIGPDYIYHSRDRIIESLKRSNIDYGEHYIYPEGLKNPNEIHRLTKNLFEQGFSKTEIEKIYYRNMLRILNQFL